MSAFSKSISDPILRNTVEVTELIGAILAAPDRPLIYPFVREYLSTRSGWVYAQEVVDASAGFFTLTGVGAVMGDLHDQGLVTTIGIAGEANRRAKWDSPATQVVEPVDGEL